MTEDFWVINSQGEREKWQPDKIRQTIINETNIDDELASKIKQRIQRKVNKLRIEKGLTEIQKADIRAEVSSQLLKEGQFDAVGENRILGMSLKEYMDLLRNGCKDNANIGYSPEMITKYSSDSIGKQAALEIMPKHCADAHINGIIHIHDLEFYLTRPNCWNQDGRHIARNGLNIDGIGMMGSTAGPAKSLEVFLNQLLHAWMAGAVVLSGGQGYANFNTILAPYAKGRSYTDIKQAIQSFIFNANMALVCRGGQILFSSIGVDLSIPDALANEEAIGPGGVPNGVYGDYQEEADLIFRAILEISEEKDYNGAYHRFPNILFHIREGDLDEYTGNCKLLHEKGANNPTLYYVNCTDIERTVMGCRTALPMNWTGDYNVDCLGTGNFMYCTLNLPLIALNSNGDRQEFYNQLGDACEIIYDSLTHRRAFVEDMIYNYNEEENEHSISGFLVQKDKVTGESFYNFDATTMTIGFCGLHECLEILNDVPKNHNSFDGEEILTFINAEKERFNERDGLRWSVIGSPAESTAHRFAEIIKEQYPNAPVQGTKDHYYLTNSYHLPVSEENNIVDHIKNAAKYSKYALGGSILHIWSGEVWSDPVAIWKLNKRIVDENIPFWAYSKTFTYCPECGFTINDELEVCPKCGSTHLYVYDRITGYYLCRETFNNGKLQEQKDRFRQKI